MADGVDISIRLRVISSTYDPSYPLDDYLSRTAGYGLSVIDALGRWVGVGITDTGVFMHNDWGMNLALGSPFAPLNTVDAFHDYDLRIDNNNVILFFDQQEVLSLPLGNVGEVTGVPPIIAWGDIFDEPFGFDAESHTELSQFQYTIVPEPTHLSLAALVFSLVAFPRVRRMHR